MNWLQSILYGFVSGLTDFLPVSSHAHQQLLLSFFGINSPDPIYNLVIHLALFYALWTGCRKVIDPIRRERTSRHHRNTVRNENARLDWIFVKNAALPMCIVLLLAGQLIGSDASLLWVSVFLLVNGIVLYAPQRMIRANRDVRAMSYFDSMILGVCSGLSGFCGISRMGMAISAADMRGVDKQHALNWAFLISVPALLLLSGMDLFAVFFGGQDIHFWSNFFTYILAAAAAYGGGYLSIMLAKIVVTNVCIYGFAYYSWGAALLTFILYLTVA